MKIKEAARFLGTTEKAIRLYEEKGLIHPVCTENNGRTFREYDERTLTELQTVLRLRQSFFSMEQILCMQKHPEQIPQIIHDYREELHTEYNRLTTLMLRADAIDESKITDSRTLAEVLTGAVTAEAGDTADTESPEAEFYTEKARQSPPPPLDFHFHVWNEEIRGDARKAAYARSMRYVEKWGKGYEAELLWKKIRVPVISVFLAVLFFLYVPCSYPVNKTYPVWEVAVELDDTQKPQYAAVSERRELTLDGVCSGHWFGEKRFCGNMEISGFHREVWLADSAYLHLSTSVDVWFMKGRNTIIFNGYYLVCEENNAMAYFLWTDTNSPKKPFCIICSIRGSGTAYSYLVVGIEEEEEAVEWFRTFSEEYFSYHPC